MMLRTTVVGLALTLAACAASPSPAVRENSSTATPSSGRLDATQMHGGWKVVSAGAGAPFSRGELLTFLPDGTYLYDGATDGGGTWSVALGSVLIFEFRGVKWSYNVRSGTSGFAEDGVGPGREELHLDGATGSFMALTRVP